MCTRRMAHQHNAAWVTAIFLRVFLNPSDRFDPVVYECRKSRLRIQTIVRQHSNEAAFSECCTDESITFFAATRPTTSVPEDDHWAVGCMRRCVHVELL